MYPQQIIDALRHVRYPGTGKDLIESGMLEDDIHQSIRSSVANLHRSERFCTHPHQVC